MSDHGNGNGIMPNRPAAKQGGFDDGTLTGGAPVRFVPADLQELATEFVVAIYCTKCHMWEGESDVRFATPQLAAEYLSAVLERFADEGYDGDGVRPTEPPRGIVFAHSNGMIMRVFGLTVQLVDQPPAPKIIVPGA